MLANRPTRRRATHGRTPLAFGGWTRRPGTARQPLDRPQLDRVEPDSGEQLDQRHVKFQRDAHEEQEAGVLLPRH